VPNGYVIALHGNWGSGKSTIINFILEYIRAHNKTTKSTTLGLICEYLKKRRKSDQKVDHILHIDFRPWIVARHQDLIAAFFKLLSEKLGPKDSRWIRLWRWLCRLVRANTTLLVDAAATVAMAAYPVGGPAFRFAGDVAKKSLNTLIDEFLSEPSLQKAYEDLRVQLGRSGRRILVTIDDIDRLEEKDVKEIMRMVKSIGQLPNVIYLLAYDRDIVRQALEQGGHRVGPRFAEKIVQQEIELPVPTRYSLFSILNEKISFVLETIQESTRWRDILREGIYRWIQSPRDVVRFSNAVKFSWAALKDEIDPQDLVAIEGLRLFDKGAFDWIRENRDFLFAEGRFQYSGDLMINSTVSDLKSRIPESHQSQVLYLVSVLLPQCAQRFGVALIMESPADITSRRGIGSEAGYDAYFRMHPSPDVIPKAEVDRLTISQDVEDIEEIIRSYIGTKDRSGNAMIAKLLDELMDRFRASPPANPTQALLDALFRVGEDVMAIDGTNDIFKLKPRQQIGFLIYDMLKQWGPEQAGENLIKAVTETTSPAFLALVYVRLGEDPTNKRSIIGDKAFNKLSELLLCRIRAAAKTKTLNKALFFQPL
jgi:hypothetical protein